MIRDEVADRLRPSITLLVVLFFASEMKLGLVSSEFGVVMVALAVIAGWMYR